MNPSEELAKEALELLRGTKSFVLAESPEYIRQLVAWEWKSGLAITLLLIVMATGAGYGWAKMYFPDREYRGYSSDHDFLCFVCFAATAALSTAAILCTFNLWKLHAAPKVWLLEHFSGMVSK